MSKYLFLKMATGTRQLEYTDVDTEIYPNGNVKSIKINLTAGGEDRVEIVSSENGGSPTITHYKTNANNKALNSDSVTSERADKIIVNRHTLTSLDTVEELKEWYSKTFKAATLMKSVKKANTPTFNTVEKSYSKPKTQADSRSEQLKAWVAKHKAVKESAAKQAEIKKSDQEIIRQAISKANRNYDMTFDEVEECLLVKNNKTSEVVKISHSPFMYHLSKMITKSGYKMDGEQQDYVAAMAIMHSVETDVVKAEELAKEVFTQVMGL
ncbi:hypothetical protein BZJ19_11610 [Salinivibrio proteolyticus]|uniref:hypothetical protein n=1 Tax=Salinivibrio proteolyticus TaxID=334715 RepID=UPI0009895B9B|nr:hypothetical protein [Salinivibrio proteolyticus]OOF24018.1 hypothetical protein BZJ19_11610 [Salinivibrio proteolyticus]